MCVTACAYTWPMSTLSWILIIWNARAPLLWFGLVGCGAKSSKGGVKRVQSIEFNDIDKISTYPTPFEVLV